MNGYRKVLSQLMVAGAFAALILVVSPGQPSVRLRAAVNYTYRLVIPEVASDKLP